MSEHEVTPTVYGTNPPNYYRSQSDRASWSGRDVSVLGAGEQIQQNTSKGGYSIGTILLIVGIILWAVGVSKGNPSMVIAGKVMVGIAVVPVVLAIACSYCACCCAIPIAIATACCCADLESGPSSFR